MKKTIFIVDDEFGTVDALTAVLEDVGYRVRSAGDGRLALEELRNEIPDLVLLDYLMPLLGGDQVLKTMRRDTRLASVPVVMMSGIPESMVRRRCRGFDAYLRKPFDLDLLLRVIEPLVAGTGKRRRPPKKR